MNLSHGKLERGELADILALANASSKVSCDSGFGSLMQRLVRILPIEGAYCCLVRLGAKSRPIFLESVHSTNIEQHWLEGYVNGSLFESDPVLRNFVGSFKQQVWSSIYTDVRRPKDKAFLESVKSIGLDRGITQGVYSKRHSMASVFAFAGHQIEADEHHRMVLETLNPFFHLAMMRCYFRDQNDLPSLSKREFEVLHWMKEGKTNWEISRILEISERTAKYHVENILSKFQVSTRTHAVALAVSGGIICRDRTRDRPMSAASQKGSVPRIYPNTRTGLAESIGLFD